VATTLALNTRFYARYNLKPLPRGALVSAEVLLRAHSAAGSPIPILTVQINTDLTPNTASPKDLWTFAKGTQVGIWQMPGSARLELPEGMVRNAFNMEGGLYLGFSANVNKCDFEIPELIVRYVRVANLLINRQLP
jgi:hypothetical protein